MGLGDMLGRAAGAIGVGEPDSAVAVGGLDLGEQEVHLGHRLLPSGEHLGVADLGLQW